MRPISQRRALQLSGLGLLSAAVGSTGLIWSHAGPRLDPQASAQLAEPEMLQSVDGLLRVRLEAAEGGDAAAGRSLPLLVRAADRQSAGPLWLAIVGDGLDGARFGLIVVVHHVLADGLTGVASPAPSRIRPPKGAPSSHQSCRVAP